MQQYLSVNLALVLLVVVSQINVHVFVCGWMAALILFQRLVFPGSCQTAFFDPSRGPVPKNTC